MTRNEFIQYANEVLDDMECLYETISQHNGEVAQFGDSWPGAMVHIQWHINQVVGIERRLAKLQGREPREFRFGVRSPR